MSRTHKRPHPATPAAARPDLSDWQGFRAQRRPARFRALVAFAVFAVVSTIALSLFKDRVGRLVFELWVFSLLALQVLVVVESDEFLRGWVRRAAPVASAFAVSAFVAVALGVGTGTALALAGAMLVVGAMPPSWLAWLLVRA